MSHPSVLRLEAAAQRIAEHLETLGMDSTYHTFQTLEQHHVALSVSLFESRYLVLDVFEDGPVHRLLIEFFQDEPYQKYDSMLLPYFADDYLYEEVALKLAEDNMQARI